MSYPDYKVTMTPYFMRMLKEDDTIPTSRLSPDRLSKARDYFDHLYPVVKEAIVFGKSPNAALEELEQLREILHG